MDRLGMSHTIGENPPSPDLGWRVRAASVAKKGLAVCGGLAVLRLLYAVGLGLPCMFHLVTGLWCPGCGATRALVALEHGDLHSAVRNNALLFLLAPILAAKLGIDLFRYIKNGAPPKDGTPWIVLSCALMAVAILFAAARNTPWFAFLAPLP